MTRRQEFQIKDAQAIAKMRVAGHLAAQVLEMLEPHIQPGISTEALDKICHDYIVNVQQAIPAPLNYCPPGHYPPFPKSICTSINHVVCHGIPNERILKSGDILNVDVTVIKEGYHGDTSKMFLVGKCSIQATRLVRLTQEALYKAIAIVKPGAKLGDIGAIIQQHAESNHLSVVREYCGHGIGTDFHEESLQILHYGIPGTGAMLKPGMTFTIEPMLNIGKRFTQVLKDGWTVITRDRSLSAQWEHTLLVTETGCDVLTKRQEETFF